MARATVKGSYDVRVTIPEDSKHRPDLKSLPELIDIPKCSEAKITFRLSDKSARGWRFKDFRIKPLKPNRKCKDFFLTKKSGKKIGNGKKVALSGRQFTLWDSNKVAGIFKYDLVVTDGTKTIKVDPGIGNGGQS